MSSHDQAPASSGPHLVVVGILRSGDQALLCHRAPGRMWYPDVWDLPGGHIEGGELPLDALRRELREELGIEVATVTDEPVARMADPANNLTMRVYVVNTWEGRVRNCQENEHDRIGWYGLGEIETLELAHPALAPLFHQLSSGRVT